MMGRKFLFLIITALFIAAGLCAALVVPDACATNYPWLSWRHDLQNTAAAPDTGYPRSNKVLWDMTRNNQEPASLGPAPCSTPVIVGGNIVITTGNGGVVEARDQSTGNLIWSKLYIFLPPPPDPPDAPPNWCQGNEPSLYTNVGICHYNINGECPDWCYECSDTPLDCSKFSLISPLNLEGFGTFVAGATIDADSGRVYFGTMDGRFFALDLATGNQVWQKEPWKDPGGPNQGRPWYDQKFAWHLSPPSVSDGKLYFGSFLPSFYYIFKAMPFVLDASGHSLSQWPSFNTNYHMYWVGRDGWAYCADKNTGTILWGWDPGG